MCEIIELENGEEIETVQEFEDQFKVNSEDYKDEDYTQIIKDACLCQLDLERFFSDRKNFEFDGVNWFKKSNENN